MGCCLSGAACFVLACNPGLPAVGERRAGAGGGQRAAAGGARGAGPRGVQAAAAGACGWRGPGRAAPASPSQTRRAARRTHRPVFTPRGTAVVAAAVAGEGGGSAGEVGFIRAYLDRIARLEKEIRRLKEVRGAGTLRLRLKPMNRVPNLRAPAAAGWRSFMLLLTSTASVYGMRMTKAPCEKEKGLHAMISARGSAFVCRCNVARARS